MYYISIGGAGPDSSKLLGRNCGHLVCDHPSWVEPWCLGIVHTYLVESGIALEFPEGISEVCDKKIQKRKCGGGWKRLVTTRWRQIPVLEAGRREVFFFSPEKRYQPA